MFLLTYTVIWKPASTVNVGRPADKCIVYPNTYMICIHRLPYQKNTIVQEYVLPDYINRMRGYVRPKQAQQQVPADKSAEQILTMNNERFMIPEILMHPSDIGIQQAGIPEVITQSVNACDPGTRVIQLLLYISWNALITQSLLVRTPWSTLRKYCARGRKYQFSGLSGTNVSYPAVVQKVMRVYSNFLV